MLENISWTTYVVVICLATVVYYLIVGLRFYGAEIMEIFNGKKKLAFPLLKPKGPEKSNEPNVEINQRLEDLHPSQQPEESPEPTAFAETSDETFNQVEDLLDQIKKAIKNSASDGLGKEALAMQLTIIFKHFPDLNGSPFQPAIAEFIISECEKSGSPQLSEDEISEMWNAA